MHSLSDSETLLKKALKDLEARWLETSSHWNDKAREDFEKEHLEPLRHAIDNASRGMRNVDHLLKSVMKECN